MTSNMQQRATNYRTRRPNADIQKAINTAYRPHADAPPANPSTTAEAPTETAQPQEKPATDEAVATTPPLKETGSPREKYIRRIHLNHDPFRTPVAEKEYEGFATRAPQSARYFTPFAYYVDPLYGGEYEGKTFQTLRAPQSLLLFGDPGQGKSTLRLATETNVRTRPDGTLAVTYKPSKYFDADGPGLMSFDAHRDAMAREMAIDLFIQIVEQLMPEAQSRENKNELLCLLIKSANDPTLQSVVSQVITEPPSGTWGYSEQWARLGRMPVRSIGRFPELASWSEELRPHQFDAFNGQDMLAGRLWNLALKSAHAWGFDRVFIMVDSIDDGDPSVAEMMRVITDLVDHEAELAEQNVYLKLFLPADLKSSLMVHLQQTGNDSRFDVIELEWSPERLNALLWARFHAAQSRRTFMSGLADKELGSVLDAKLIEAAAGSPRRLLRLVDELITAHTSRQPDATAVTPFTLDDWETAQEAIAFQTTI